MVRLSLVVSLLMLLLLSVTGSASSPKLPLDAIHPIFMTADTLIASPGQTVQFTVLLSGEADGTEEFTITSTGGAFESLPNVTVPLLGLSIVSFSGVVGQTSSRTTTVSISDGNYTVSTRLLIGGL